MVAEVPAVSPSAQALPASGSEVSVKGVWLGADGLSAHGLIQPHCQGGKLQPADGAARSWPLRRAGIRFMAMASLTRSTAHSSTGSPVMVVVLSPAASRCAHPNPGVHGLIGVGILSDDMVDSCGPAQSGAPGR